MPRSIRILTAVAGASLLGIVPTGCYKNNNASHGSRPGSAASSSERGKEASTELTQRQRDVLCHIKEVGGIFDGGGEQPPKTIDLASDRVFADSDLVRSLSEFPQLRQLRLSASDTAPDAFSALATLTKLTELALQDAPLDDQQLARILASMPDLEQLTLRRMSEVSDDILPTLIGCSQLTTLSLIEMNGITGKTLSGLKQIESLRALDLRGCGNLTRDDFKRLVEIHQLRELKAGGPLISDDVLRTIATHPCIRSLTIEDAEVSGECLRELSGEPDFAERLQRLSFARCFGVTDDTLSALVHFPKLASLSLRKIFVTGSFIRDLSSSESKPPPLRTLIVRNGFVSDESLAALPTVFPKLERLDLRGNTEITDTSLPVFNRLSKLRELHLEDTGVSNPPADKGSR